LLYAFSENFMLAISHDEVVHGKASLIGKMPGDEWRRFANVRAFMAYMYGHPGKKLLFMGQEFGQYEEWSEQRPLRWELLQFGLHSGLQSFVRDLNSLVKKHPALYEVDFHWEGFEWIDINDVENSIISFVRWAKGRTRPLVFICNFTPVVRYHYHLGAPVAGQWREILNSDDPKYGGSGVANPDFFETEPVEAHFRPQRFNVTLPPLSVIVLEPIAPANEAILDVSPIKK
jgi:1,4-alpha-glucan branching enzyme